MLRVLEKRNCLFAELWKVLEQRGALGLAGAAQVRRRALESVHERSGR